MDSGRFGHYQQRHDAFFLEGFVGNQFGQSESNHGIGFTDSRNFDGLG
mgnify:CR=1